MNIMSAKRTKLRRSMVHCETIIFGLRITITEHCVHIEDSYLITKRKKMKELFVELRKQMDDCGFVFASPLDHRSDRSFIHEWVSHNNAYKLGYKRERTADVDLNWPQKWYVKILYFVCSLITL